MSLQHLPPTARRALARRELARRGVPAVEAEGPSREDLSSAIEALCSKLEELVPAPDTVFDVDTPFYRRVATKQPPDRTAQVKSLAARIKAQATTDADQVMLASLPVDALKVLDMTPAQFVTFWGGTDDKF
jgi:hypothetical protein